MSTRKATFWGLLVLATVGLSRFFAAYRTWQAGPTAGHAALAAGIGLAVIAVIGWLGFILYEVDRAAGRVRHQVRLYEWVIAMRQPPGQPKAGGAVR
jgi:hypothetical protein